MDADVEEFPILASHSRNGDENKKQKKKNYEVIVLKKEKNAPRTKIGHMNLRKEQVKIEAN